MSDDSANRRSAELRHADVAVRLAAREARLAALHERLAISMELSEKARTQLHMELTAAASAAAAARDERDAAVLEAHRAASRLAESRSRLESAERAADDERQARRRAEVQLTASLDDAAAEHRRLVARIDQLEQQARAGIEARDELVREKERDADELRSRLAEAAGELEEARLAQQRAERQAREQAPIDVPAPSAPTPSLPPESEVVAELREERDAIERASRVSRGEHAARIRELEQLVSTLSVTLAQTRTDIGRAEQSRAWRLGHGVMRGASRALLRPDRTDGALVSALRRIDEVQRATRALPAAPGSTPRPVEGETRSAPSKRITLSPGRVAAQRRLLATEIRSRLGPTPELEHWPAVSIVVPSRNGLPLLQQLVNGLREHTDYDELELVVVDNASDDGTAEWLRTVEGLKVRVDINADNVSYSQANAQGAAAAVHDLLLFLNNDIEPFERGWLRELVAAHVLGRSTLTGATLLHSERTEESGDGRLVQHRHVGLWRTPAGVLPYNVGDGDDLFGPAFGVEQEAIAVSGACLLVDRQALERLGGFSSRYRYGLEDVDLALRAGKAGLPVVATGRAVVYHAESVTRAAEGSDFTRATRENNRRALQETWGPQLRRCHERGILAGDRTLVGVDGPRVAITVTSLDPADGWGDWYTAHELGDALADRGWDVAYFAVSRDGSTEVPAGVDYVISLLDRFDARVVPDHVTVIAWIRNWTERWMERPWLSRADVLLASSQRTADLLTDGVGRPAVLFPLATNATRFAGAPASADRATDAVFTGNHWGQDRAIQVALAPGRGQTLAIYGKGWDGFKDLSRHARGVAEYDALPAIYASTRLVLDDTQAPTLEYDAVNSRVFDALAAGSLVLTNCVAGVRELFDDDFPVWSTPAELRAQRDALLADDARRTALAERYRAAVLSAHTYEHRADRLVELLRERAELPSFCIKIGAPDWEQAHRWGDLHFARGIEHELRRRGHRVLIQVLEEWENDEGLTYDVVVHLKGLSRHFPKPGQFNVLWCISHPNELTGEECDGYDLVAIASEPFAEVMRRRTSTPVVVLEQATDPRVFYRDPHPDQARHHDVVYVANSRNVLRPMMRDLLPTDLDLAVYGANWEGLIDMKYVVSEHVPNAELRRIYSSAKVVLADHWDDMREHGFVSNRIYDALACGAVVVSDDVAGLRDRFGGAVRTYSAADELSGIVRELLTDKAAPTATAAATFATRTDDLCSAVDALRVHRRHRL